jgi:hypothetical protein
MLKVLYNEHDALNNCKELPRSLFANDYVQLIDSEVIRISKCQDMNDIKVFELIWFCLQYRLKDWCLEGDQKAIQTERKIVPKISLTQPEEGHNEVQTAKSDISPNVGT